MNNCDIGIFGLGIMGQNLALNFAGRGFSVVVYNRWDAGEDAVLDTFISKRCRGKRIAGFHDLPHFVNSIRSPRKILLMVQAGKAVDTVLEQLLPLLEPEDIVIDGGNSHYRDTAQRLAQLEKLGIHYVGCGLSGGGDGALNGPAIMPGGSLRVWEQIGSMFQAISARSADGVPCCDWIGPGGAGHFVKMVHNGVEYALMQMLAEVYDVMKRMLLMSAAEIHDELFKWHNEELHSYLLGITIDILKVMDIDGLLLVDKILDCAGHKGTGKDASIAALELGVSATVISEAINARLLSALIADRRHTAEAYVASEQFTGDKAEALTSLHDALCCSQLIAYLQGFSLIAQASEEFGWGVKLLSVARIWKAGCIIQSETLNRICAVLVESEGRVTLSDAWIKGILKQKQQGWRRAMVFAVKHGIPVPAISASLAYFDGMRSERLPTNLIQAQRDFFGAHGFERNDRPRGIIFHSEWGRDAI